MSLKWLPPYDNQKLFLFNEILLYKHIKEQSSDNKMGEAIYVAELPLLLDRFWIFPTTAILQEADTAADAAEYFLRKALIAITRRKALFILRMLLCWEISYRVRNISLFSRYQLKPKES
jgi:hypothetical protein